LDDFGVPTLPTPPPPTPPPNSGSGTRFFQFLVKNSFSFFTSNAEKALAAAGRAAGSLGAGIEWSDDEDTSSTGGSGFLFKVGLFMPVNRGAYINAFKAACQYEGLNWGSSGDIIEDETCINEGQACPQDWDCPPDAIVQCADYCCGPYACVTDRFGQNPGVCK
jgi:hypothetical protein